MAELRELRIQQQPILAFDILESDKVRGRRKQSTAAEDEENSEMAGDREDEGEPPCKKARLADIPLSSVSARNLRWFQSKYIIPKL